MIVDFFGLPGSGKSVLSHLVAEQLKKVGYTVNEVSYNMDHYHGKKIRTLLKVKYTILLLVYYPQIFFHLFITIIRKRQSLLSVNFYSYLFNIGYKVYEVKHNETADIIIFDESTSMLDPQGKASINAQIRKLHEEKNITILSITHDMEEVAQSENVIVLENGEIAMQGTPMDIFRQEDKLAKMQLDIPFALKISKELKKRGIFKENVCRLDEVVEKLCRLK